MLIRRILAFILGFTLMWGVLGTQYVFGMASTQFGTYSQAYIDRQNCKAKATGKRMEDMCLRAKRRQR